MNGRPDLDAIKASLDFPPPPEARLISGYWRQKLLDVIDYAASLERELAAARPVLEAAKSVQAAEIALREAGENYRAYPADWRVWGRAISEALGNLSDARTAFADALARGDGTSQSPKPAEEVA